jgi:hypothetical protein
MVLVLVQPLVQSAGLGDDAAPAPAVAAIASPPQAPPPTAPSPPADTFSPTQLTIDTGRAPDAPVTLRGRDARQQLVVTASDSADPTGAAGQARDFTGQVTYEVSPPGIVSVDAAGFVAPTADGKATVTAHGPANLSAAKELVVEGFSHDVPINFPNQIVPIFTRYGCNGGGCHGKSGGQNGFRLSLLGFEPGEDYEHLVKEGRGRRLFPAAPDRSLLLVKAINALPHGGGPRLSHDSHEYRLLARWIGQGMPYGNPTDPTVVRISVYPEARTMRRAATQQLAVLAHYSDGSLEDVTQLAKYEPNDNEMAEVGPTGLVRTLDLTGDVSIMARYQGSVAVFQATIPLGAAVDQLPPGKNFIDELVFKKLKTLGLPPSPVCDDATFIRRATIDIAGRLPTTDETNALLADASPDKRDRLVDRLLASPDYADYFANKWNAVVRNRRQQASYIHGTYNFHAWIRDSLYQNMPYDEFVRSILAASGEVSDHPPVAWYREVKDVEQQVEDSAQLFLGLRIQCARCHHHPFEKWSQRDYYGFGAFFSQVARKPGIGVDEQIIFHRRGQAGMNNPKTGERLKPTGLGAAPIDVQPERDPRHALVDWMTTPDNPFFARALVNRYWKHFFGRGIVEPEDDMRVTNPASNPELLDALAKQFREHGWDLKLLVRTLCTSSAYQLSSEPNAFNAADKQNFSRHYPKRLAAEVLLDALDSVTGAPSSFASLPAGTRAVQLPDSAVNSYFLTVFGRPEMSSACECERSTDANLAQSLHLLNSSEMQSKLSVGSGRAATLARDAATPPEQKVRQLYLLAFSRQPTEKELSIAAGHFERSKDKQQAFEDIEWALVNSKEFLFNH